MLECFRLFDATHLQRLSEGAPHEKRLDINVLRQASSTQKSTRHGPAQNIPKKAVLMPDTPILLREQQYHQIKAVLARLRMDSSAKVVFLVDKDGQEIASQGEVGTLDTTSLASLAAGNVAATGGMAQLIGEKEFPTLSHEGERESIHICVIGRLLLMVVFDERSSLGLVKLRSRQISNQIATMFAAITEASNDHSDSPFAGITDEDIDSLFN
jgi:predicted regulator of Ras-like GTPase activity (Roadblock/LC7/MglB family)